MVDAVNFLKENFNFIKNKSIEGCPSVLFWLPEKSYIWKTYGSKMECPWKLKIGRRTTWNHSEVVLRHSAGLISPVFSPDSRYIVSGSNDKTLQIWNITTGECEAELIGHLRSIKSVIFSHDGMHIVSASRDNTVRIWNTITGECEAVLEGHSDCVNSAVFSPEGKYIVSASADNTARIWNRFTLECEAMLKGHSHDVISAVFSSDGVTKFYLSPCSFFITNMLIPHFPQLLRRAQHLMVTTCIPHRFLTYTMTLSSINITHRLYSSP